MREGNQYSPSFFFNSMKVNTTLSHDAEYIGDIQEHRVGIDKSNIDFITTLLTSNLYSKPLESFLRETIANAYDSHIEAGTDEHILLLIEDVAYREYYSSSTYRISIRDYGVGVSPERFDKIYKNIGSSTKRESNDYIGMFGIGRFSCLSCADTANITSYYNGVKYSYIMYKNGGGINIDMVSTEKGNYKDGLEVSIEKTVEHAYQLENAIKGICLFDKVHITYKGASHYLKTCIDSFNNRKITHYKNFSKCSMLSTNRNYFKVGNVLYTGKTEGIDTTDGIIVNLPIGSVDITPNREALQYTDYTNNTIKKQVALVKQELQDMVNESSNGDYSLASFCEHFVFGEYFIIEKYNNTGNPDIVTISKDDVNFDTSKLTIDKEPLPAGYFNFLRQTQYFSVPDNITYKAINPQSHYRHRRSIFDHSIKGLILNKFDLIEKGDKVTKQVTMQYTTETQTKPMIILEFNGLDNLKLSLRLFVLNSGWANTLNLDACIDYTFKHIPIKVMSNDSVPSSYIETFKEVQRGKRKKMDTDKVSIRIYGQYGYKIDYLSNLPKKGIIIYTSHTTTSDDRERTLKELAELCGSTPSVAAVITVRKDFIKLIDGSKRYISIENFIFMRNKILSKFVTSYIIENNFLKTFGNLYEYSSAFPLWKEYLAKYKVEHNMQQYSRHTNTVTDIINLYKDKGWINKADINYFALSEEEITAFKDWKDMQNHREDIIKRLALKKHGVLPKIGLIPRIPAKNYVKQ